MVRLRDATARMHYAKGGMVFILELFGDYLAEREGYKEHDGLDAVRYYLMCKHNWLPYDVRSMSDEDLEFAISEEKSGWVMPPEYRGLYPNM